jgi:hypothetical protein
MCSIINHYTATNPANLGPLLGSQALPVTSQDKVGSDRGVTPLNKKNLGPVGPAGSTM